MNFFINAGFGEQNSGIEHAQLKRAQLFRDHGEPFKLVFVEWIPRLHFLLSQNGVSEDETLNLFDFFQRAEEVPDRVLQAEDLSFGIPAETRLEDTAQKFYRLLEGQKTWAQIHYFEDDGQRRVSIVELFDRYGNLYRVDNYDHRGFLSLSQYYTPESKIGTEIWYDVNGKPVLESYNRYDATGKFDKAGWRLTYDDNGATYSFKNIDELTQYFFNRINAKYWSNDKLNVFILDRNHVGDWSILDLERPAYVAMHLHNGHTGDSQDTLHSILNNFYEYGLVNMNRYDAVISATHKQTADLIVRFDPKCALFTIPVGVIPDEVFKEPRIPMSERKRHSVLVTARVAWEKQIGHIIRSIGIAREKIPDINFDFYGFVDHRDDDAAQKEINSAIREYGLEEAVHQHSYSSDVPALHKGSQIYALNSLMEGFNLSLMEAQSRGMVTITTDVNYGPNELTVDGENGYVVPFDGIQEMADRLVELFSDDEKLQRMSDKAYELSERFSEANVWKAWQGLLEAAKAKKFSYVADISIGLGDQTS